MLYENYEDYVIRGAVTILASLMVSSTTSVVVSLVVLDWMFSMQPPKNLAKKRAFRWLLIDLGHGIHVSRLRR